MPILVTNMVLLYFILSIVFSVVFFCRLVHQTMDQSDLELVLYFDMV